MQTSKKFSTRISSHPLVLVGLVSGLIALAACQPIRDPSVIAAQQTATATGAPAAAVTAPAATAPETTATPAEEVSGVEPATVTISARSLRVRALPSNDADVVAAVSAGDTFTVTGISSDGEWIQVAIADGPDGLGWVSAEFVTLKGDITNIATVDIATAAATSEPTEAVTPEAATPEATAVMTEEVTAEPTIEATAVMTEEATVEATETVTAEVTPEATEEATPEPTAEATEEATPAPTEEATPAATDEAASPDLGTVTIVVDLPLRVRSAPTTDTDNKIGSVYNDEIYKVLEISADGKWVKIATPQFPEGSGWISAEFVVFNEAQ